ncbi:DUF6716 putative glycosyltransferase [Aeromicrobium sp. CTD01-1L150]|uniref:DUF6716 putative glycosyltransferase n=1 Tax=Aeromicrobium sp. CTD01-1L150 TaxID=3341830 RepID=UPI0035C06EC0
MLNDDVVRVLVLADTDSYVKWGAALADRFPDDWHVELLIARGAALPSPSQVADALAGTSHAGRAPRLIGLTDLRRRLEDETPDVLVLAARGWTVQAAVSVVRNAPTRPVIVTGLPGVGVPVLPYGLGFRRAADVFVVHSRRELREFRHASRRLGLPDRFELARLPYLQRLDLHRPRRTPAPPSAGPVVFAAQALVPSGRSERQWLVERLAAAARARPDREVVVKVRARAGEAQTHHEQVSYTELVETLPERPVNLVVRTGPMHHHLDGASGFVTVSSTALLEAVAAGVPAVAVDDFGVGVSQINLSLRGSGLLGPADDVVEGRFRHADLAWCADNYFHPPAEDTWLERVCELVAQRAATGLPAYCELPGSWRNGFRHVLYRHFAFTNGSDRSGVAAAAERTVALSALWLNQRRSRLLRSLWPSPRGAGAMAFAQENAESAPGASS